MSDNLPGNGFFGWLGRQVGHVKKAVRKDVTKDVIHRRQHVEEAKLPDKPNLTLRRTTIDEVIVEKENGGADDAGGNQGTA
jgi:hypothetical protein